jgi:ribosomal-protein-alanine N-acetyltransferase
VKARAGSADDAARMAQLHAAAFERPWPAAEIAALLASGAECAIADDAGFILWRTAGGEAEILTLAVAPIARRRGAGRALAEFALDQAERGGARSMFLEVAENNLAAIALYAALGFEAAGGRKGYYRDACGQMRDALILRRALNTPGHLGVS